MTRISSWPRTPGTPGASSSVTAIRARLLSYHEHNEAARVAELLPRLEAGERIALVTDAGMPVVSDPGARLVRAALDAGVEVTVLPGASAVETALVASGLGGAGYGFVGFLPRKAGALDALWRELESWAFPVVAFESAQRLPATLRSLAAFDADREVAVCRELTKRFEEVVRGPAGELAARFAAAPKGEITLVIAAAGAAAPMRRGRRGRGPRGRGRARRGGNAQEGRRRCRRAPNGHVSKRPLSRLFVTTL